MEKVASTLTWENLTSKKIEKNNKFAETAKSDALSNIPASDSLSLTVVENEIINNSEIYLQKHIEKGREHFLEIENKQNQLTAYLQQNHFEPIVSKLKITLSEIINNKTMKLVNYKSSYDVYAEEKKAFKRYHQLSAKPNSATVRTTIIAFTVIMALLIIEMFANTLILSPAMTGGEAEALSIAASVAFLNVFISSFVGYYVLKNLNHLEKSRRKFYGVMGGVYLLVIIYVNSALGAYRSQAEIVFNNFIAGDGKMSKLLINSVTPWNVEFSFIGIILTFIGISFAIIAMIDGLFYNDVYPGYGKIGQKVNKFIEAINKTKNEYANEVSSLFSKCNKEFQKKLDDLLQNDLNNWDSNTNLLQKEFVTYENKVRDIEENTNHMLGEYRNENRRVRTTPAPAYFANQYLINNEKKSPDKVFREVAFFYLDDPQRINKKLEYNSMIQEYFKKSQNEVEILQKRSEDVQKNFNEIYRF